MNTVVSRYVYITVGKVGSTTDSITQRLWLAEIGNRSNGKREKMALLYDALKEKGKTLVFVQRKATASWLQGRLWKDKAEAIHGDRTQSQRESALAAFRNGHL